MRHQALLISALLLLWIAGASYWYVCRIRCDCGAAVAPALETIEAGDSATPSPEQLLKEAVEEASGFISAAGVQKGFFPSSSADGDAGAITPGYLTRLKLLTENNPAVRIEITGHADITGPEEFNVELGLRRAQFMKAFLVNAGIDAGRIVISSRGSSEPAATNSTPEGRAANRRSEIKVII